MVTTDQYIEKLGTWSIQIAAKTLKLNKNCKIYAIGNYLLSTQIAILSVVLIGINSYFLADPNISDSAKLGLNITVLILQVFLAFCNISLSVIKPAFKSYCFGTCSKLYYGIQREIETKIEEAKNDLEIGDYNQNYLSDLMSFTSREQVILQMEPVSFGREPHIIKSSNFDQGEVTDEELELVLALINKHGKKKREALMKIFNKVFHSIDK